MPSDNAVRPPLNEVQLMLLRLFSYEIKPAKLEALRRLLLEFYEKELQDELERVIQEKNITREDFEHLLEQQQRTKS